MKRWIFSPPFLLLALLILPGGLAAQYDDPGGPGGGGSDCTGANVVEVHDNFFQPKTITIDVGETVTWCYVGPGGFHNVREEGGGFRCANGCDQFGGDGSPASNDWKFSLEFTEAGTVDYVCEVHVGLGMTGQVIVQGNGGGGGGGGDGGGGGGDEPGQLSFRFATYQVDESGGTVQVGVQRSGGDDGSVGVDVTTANGSASAGSDYTATSRTLSWANGDDANKTLGIPIVNDAAAEGDETFTVSLSNATGGATIGSPSSSTITIRDDDLDSGPGALAFSSFAFGVFEGGTASVEVRRTGGTSGQVSADYQTAAGSAAAGDDFQNRSGTVELGDGEDRASISLPVSSDGASEPVETFTVRLSNPGGGATLTGPRTASVVVFDAGESQAALSADEVLCDGFRLAGLLDRVGLVAPNTDKPLGINLTFTRSGDFAGLAYTGNGPGTAEHHLAFSTNPEETTLLRNPDRPQLSAVSLARNQTNSDLVPETAMDALTLQLNPTLQERPDPVALLTINDVGDPATRAGGSPAESKPGRGLSTLVRPCHGKLTARDQHVFQVLAKIARASADGAEATELAIFRGEDEDTYRIDVYPVAADGSGMGRLAVELEIDFGPGDRLDGGTLRMLGSCNAQTSADCTSVGATTQLQLVEPKFSGEFWNASPYSVSNGGAAESTVDFADLLAGTSWRRPL